MKFWRKQGPLILFFCLGWQAVASGAIPVTSEVERDTQSKQDINEIVFIDENIADPEGLATRIGPEKDIYILEKDQQGLQQIADVLTNYHHLSALHIISHGSSGELMLGNANFTPLTLSLVDTKYLADVGRSLSEDGDILFYGCDFAAGDTGTKAVTTVAALTGADVQASTNRTGNSDLQADWTLEFATGAIESSSLQGNGWIGVLADEYCVDDQGQRIVPDPDADGDGVLDCYDCCPNDPLKKDTDVCGCGNLDTDTDMDGTADCIDACDNDPDKILPGICGCGESEADMDNDGTPNCIDVCPADPLKTIPGSCDCGIQDTDVDGDGVADCKDGCLHDPLKSAPGLCGCGVVDSDTDTDGDGTIDCNDQCPNDMNKVDPNTCGCGIADIDTDSDGTLDCNEGCPSDPDKIVPGECGCGIADTDTDGDGTVDCHDTCPSDMSKTEPGQCGCGIADTDTDGDGTVDCHDACPSDMSKIEPGQCGCGVVDTDSNNDGTADCVGGVVAGFPWHMFLHNFTSHCEETPTFCYMVADGDNLDSENSPLLKYDFETGALQMLGRLGVGMVEAIAIGMDGETLYGVDNGTLGLINTTPGSGRFTPLNAAGIGRGNGALGSLVFGDIDSLSFDPTSGILYGSERRFDGQGHGVDLLVKIDHTNGTVIKNGFGPGLEYVIINTAGVDLFDTDDIAFDFSGKLYGIASISGGGGGDRLMVIDKQSGRIIDHGPLRSGSNPVQDMEGLTFYHGDILYGTTGFEFSKRGTSNTLYKVNSKTGETQTIIRLDKNFNGYIPKDFEAIACPVCR